MAWAGIKSSFKHGYALGLNGSEVLRSGNSEFEEENKNAEKFANERKFENPTGSAFVYEDVLQSLDEECIRLLKILPGLPGDVIHCELRSVILAPPLKYEALSYCWGDEKEPQVIYIDGKIFKVTQNLRSALRHLRSKTVSRDIWVDAICINQSNREEKTYQIQLMSRIYGNASKTNIWIGPASHQSQGGFFICRILARAADAEALNPASDPSRDVVWTNLERTYAENCLTVEEGPIWNEDFVTMLRSPWFTRAWVIQEAILSPNSELHCGFESIDWPNFTKAIKYGIEKQLLISRSDKLRWLDRIEHADTFAPTRSDIPQDSPAELLYTYLMEFRYRQASVPVDKVFSLLGLVDNVQAIGIQADYESSVDKVYWNVTIQILKRTGHLCILGALPRDPKPGLSPSWTADWTSEEFHAQPLGYAAERHHMTYQAAGNSVSKVEFEDDNKILVLAGFRYGKIEAISSLLQKKSQAEIYAIENRLEELESVAYDRKNPAGVWQKVKKSATSIGEANKFEGDLLVKLVSTILKWENFVGLQEQTGASRDEYRQALCAGCHIDGDEELTKVEFEKWLKSLSGHRKLAKVHRSLNKSATVTRVVHYSSVWTEESRFPEALVFAFGRRLAKVNGRLALVPPAAEVGDEILLCQGGRVPLVARCVDGSRILLGESYVNGIMRGEAYKEELCEELRFK